MLFFQKGYKNSAGVTQPEINRIVRSLRKVPQNESAPFAYCTKMTARLSKA